MARVLPGVRRSMQAVYSRAPNRNHKKNLADLLSRTVSRPAPKTEFSTRCRDGGVDLYTVSRSHELCIPAAIDGSGLEGLRCCRPVLRSLSGRPVIAHDQATDPEPQKRGTIIVQF